MGIKTPEIADDNKGAWVAPGLLTSELQWHPDGLLKRVV